MMTTLETLKDELIYARQRGGGRGWQGAGLDGARWCTPAPDPTPRPSGPSDHQADLPADVTPRAADARLPEAERRQLTVLFCDLVDSTAALQPA